ncbi:PepSY domain-containing protein [Streptomyces sp. NPDC007110]|uniref:PepSY domain-containing protein n=1 Tax=Streptomyces TaxID=1883 RepID=UPI0033D9FA59
MPRHAPARADPLARSSDAWVKRLEAGYFLGCCRECADMRGSARMRHVDHARPLRRRRPQRVRMAVGVTAATAAALLVTGCGNGGGGGGGEEETRSPTSAPATTPNHETTPPSSASPSVSKDRAEKAALAAVPGSRVVSSDLDHEDGRQVWEVVVTDGNGKRRKVDVDAGTGKVLARDDTDTDHDADDSATPDTDDTTRDGDDRSGG